MNQPVATPNPPTLRSLMDSLKVEIFNELNCHLLGTITEYNKNTQVASVQISSLRVLPDGSQVQYPLLTDCPVFVAGGTGGFLLFPIKVGDPCLVLFHDTDFDKWFTTGNVVAPNSSRTHSLSDGLVLPGFRSLANAVVGDAYIHLKNTAGNCEVLLYDTGELNVIGRTSGGGVSFLKLTNKVNLGNLTGVTLGAALDNLCTALEAWVNTGGSTPNTATIAAIAAVRSQLSGLLS